MKINHIKLEILNKLQTDHLDLLCHIHHLKIPDWPLDPLLRAQNLTLKAPFLLTIIKYIQKCIKISHFNLEPLNKLLTDHLDLLYHIRHIKLPNWPLDPSLRAQNLRFKAPFLLKIMKNIQKIHEN